MTSNNQLLTRLTVLALVLFVELMTISLSFDAYLPRIFNDATGFGFLAYTGQLAKFLVVVIAAFALAIWVRVPEHFEALKRVVPGYRFYYFFVLQLLAFAVFYLCTANIFGSERVPGTISGAIVLGWFISLFAVGGLWLLSVGPLTYWLRFIVEERKATGFSIVVGILGWWLAQSAQGLWDPLSELTFYASAILLNLVYPDIIVDPGIRNLGTQNFVVNIAPACSGYEGIGLVTIFTAFYLSVFRREFRFPQALLLFPIGIITIWLFNILRIVILIAIGSSFSESVALGGFHSQAGWISFIAVIFGLLTIAHKVSFFSVERTESQPLGLPAALLLPFVTLLATTILTSALSADFDWFYPLRVIATACALGLCWKLYDFSRIKLKFEPVAAGILVFVIWILLVPNDQESNQIFAETLFGASTGLSTFWLVMRFLGAVVTVPLAEELVFRGYLLARLAKQDILIKGRIPFSWLALLVSSGLFGLLHSDLLAGVLAGLVYGVVRYRSDSVMDAVIAHAVTNLLLSILVLSTGNWSMW